MRTRQQTKNPFGVMVMERSRLETRPMYHEVLLRHGFVDRQSESSAAWGLWTRVCEDRVVVRMSNEIEKPRHMLLTSVVAGYSHYSAVLAKMTARQKAALKKRLGVRLV